MSEKRKGPRVNERDRPRKANGKAATARGQPVVSESSRRRPNPSGGSRLPAFRVVALGASAGGLQALETFFAAMPSDSGMAFIVITHLHEGQPSMLFELLGRKTAMPVTEVRKSTRLQPNHVYTVSPGFNLVISNGILQPIKPERGSIVLPIDYFFRSLAQDQKDRAIGIIMSGMGSDGSLGIKEIKAALGMVMVQQEASAAYPDMPQNALATGLVDYVLAPDEMPAKLTTYVRDGLSEGQRPLPVNEEHPSEARLGEVLALLRTRTRHDFSHYKSSTINRRVERRMTVHQVDTIDKYVQLLQDHPEELDLLFKELLIGVTSFFRDPEAFELLGETLAALLAKKPETYQVRVWVPGCSTGEEAYSIAILLREYMERSRRSFAAQIFATDLDADSIDVARAGLYPGGIANDLTPKRLKRFFIRDERGYRVTRDIREMVYFASQNVIEDPPFTKVDLLSCRNLLIYLDNALQRRLLPIFHYALKPEGLLFLGSSESIGPFGHLFAAVDKKCKVFKRKVVAEGTYMAEFPAGIRGTPSVGDRPPAPRPAAPVISGDADKVILRELVPPTVIVRERGEVVHIHGRTGLFLEPAPGPQPVVNIFGMLREGLQIEVASLLHRAAASEGEVTQRDVRFKPNGHAMLVDLHARRLDEPEAFRGTIVLSFRDARPLASAMKDRKGGPAQKGKAADRMLELERNLLITKESHQKAVEDLETANEELKSANEELQSTNEELETSKEEMQSLNEELQTVNAELQGKVDELSRANDDMNNLLNATDIATIFLDNDLNITRYTEQAKRIMRLIPSDVGRPIGDLVTRIRYDRLTEDAQEVLSTLIYREFEVRGDDRSWYLIRILPYRTTDNVIDGLVMTFIDISKVKMLQENERRIMQALQSSATTVFGQDRDLRYTWVCSAAFGRTPDSAVGRKDADIFGSESARVLQDLKQAALARKGGSRHTVQLQINGKPRVYDLHLEAMRDESGAVIGVSGVQTDVTEIVHRPGN